MNERIAAGHDAAGTSVISIVGPTASGKSELAVALVRMLEDRGERAEIINADAYQMYRGMDVGTAKPTPSQQAEAVHHLIDVIDPEAYTLSMAYSDNSQVILTKANSGIATLADLAGKIVGVQLGTSADLMLQNDQAERRPSAL